MSVLISSLETSDFRVWINGHFLTNMYGIIRFLKRHFRQRICRRWKKTSIKGSNTFCLKSCIWVNMAQSRLIWLSCQADEFYGIESWISCKIFSKPLMHVINNWLFKQIIFPKPLPTALFAYKRLLNKPGASLRISIDGWNFSFSPVLNQKLSKSIPVTRFLGKLLDATRHFSKSMGAIEPIGPP